MPIELAFKGGCRGEKERCVPVLLVHVREFWKKRLCKKCNFLRQPFEKEKRI